MVLLLANSNQVAISLSLLMVLLLVKSIRVSFQTFVSDRVFPVLVSVFVCLCVSLSMFVGVFLSLCLSLRVCVSNSVFLCM